MMKVGKTVGAALLFICATVGVYFPHASAATHVHSVDCTFEPVSVPKKAGLVKLELAFTPKHECDEVTVRVSKLLNAEYTGDTLWVVPVEKGKWYRRQIEITIPPNDTSGIEVTMVCGHVPTTPACYFVTTDETVEVYAGKPSHKPRRYSQPTTGDPIRDTLTSEQLQTLYEVLVDLRDPDQLSYARSLLGPLPDSAQLPGYDGGYKLVIPLDVIMKLAERGIELEFTTPPPWSRKYQRLKDSVPQPPLPLSPETDEVDVDTLTPEQTGNPQLCCGNSRVHQMSTFA